MAEKAEPDVSETNSGDGNLSAFSFFTSMSRSFGVHPSRMRKVWIDVVSFIGGGCSRRSHGPGRHRIGNNSVDSSSTSCEAEQQDSGFAHVAGRSHLIGTKQSSGESEGVLEVSQGSVVGASFLSGPSPNSKDVEHTGVVSTSASG